MKKTIVIATAFADELQAYFGYFDHYERKVWQNIDYIIVSYMNINLVLIATGIGTSACAGIMTHAIASFSPDYLFFSGTSGAVDSSLAIGDVVIGAQAFDADLASVFDAVIDTPFEHCLISPVNNKKLPECYHANEQLLQLAQQNRHDLRLRSGIIATSNYFPAPAETFRQIKQRGADVIDMETAAFYQMSWLFDIPALAVRGVSNILDEHGQDDDIADSKIAGCSAYAAAVVMRVIKCLA